jgi:beta-glucosidase
MTDSSRPWWQQGNLLFAVGIEDTFIPQTRVGERALDEYHLTQHYAKWASDIDLIVESGARMVRWGIPWYLVNPTPATWDWSWLDRVAEKFKSAGITPIIDLLHYGTPLWLDNEFYNPRYPEAVAEYARQIARRYADDWYIYTPLNEPMLHALYCGFHGYWPPYGTGDADFVRIIRALQRGVVATQSAIWEELGDRASFVHVEASFRFIADHPDAVASADFLRERAFILEDLVTGQMDVDHTMYAYLKANGFTDEDFEWSKANIARPNVMGVNYYPAGQTEIVSVTDPRSGGPDDFRPRSNAWTTGLADVLTTFAARYRIPVFLTETSHVGTAEDKSAWLRDSVATVRELRADGLDVVGYTWWSLFDMIEWTYRNAIGSPNDYRLAMGLWRLEIDEAGEFHRVRTPLVDQFRAEAMA